MAGHEEFEGMAGHSQRGEGGQYYSGSDQEQELLRRMQGMAMNEVRHREMEGRMTSARVPAGSRNYTFDDNRMHAIGRENQALLDKLQRIAVKGSGASAGKVPTFHKKLSNQEINRRKRENEIARENLKIANRLHNAKSAAFDKKKMKENQAMQEKYLKNASHYPIAPGNAPRLRTKPAPAGKPPWFKELPPAKAIERPEWQS